MSEDKSVYGNPEFIEAIDAFCQANEPAPSQQESSISMTMPEIVDVINSYFGDTCYGGIEISAELKKRGYVKILSIQDMQFRILFR
jgi:hypothetical protein